MTMNETHQQQEEELCNGLYKIQWTGSMRSSDANIHGNLIDKYSMMYVQRGSIYFPQCVYSIHSNW